MNYNLIINSDDQTVASEYIPTARSETDYQTEEQLENSFINQLKSQGYQYLDIHTDSELKNNLRTCLSELNNYQFSDKEWDVFFSNVIANKTDGIQEKTEKIQKDFVQVLIKDDGTCKNIKLIDKVNVFNNKVQVIHQKISSGNFENRYDVTVLVNGFPLVHCELKKRGISLREAFNQIDRYQRDSFWSGSGLYEYIQIFVISNGTDTKYYSNTTRFNVVEEHDGKRRTKRITSGSFKFASNWSDSKNKIISDLVDFTKTFFQKGNLLRILTRYCVFTENKSLMVMRPYQIVATERILNKILIAENNNLFGTINAGGYIWHTTGSGKTLTSFKTSQLASEMPCIDKVLFVVDRQDLDYQTMREYDRFQKGAANGNKSTKELEKQMSDSNARIIITTIQKLSVFCKKYQNHEIFNKKVVLIFDECHRSQFGEQHSLITKMFKKYAIFGFTGTPIFAKNSSGPMVVSNSKEKSIFSNKTTQNLKTTGQIFGERLHTYTVVNAINDGNVIPFKIDYVNTIRDNKGDDTLIECIDDEKILLAPERVSNVVSYIIQNFGCKTMRSGIYNNSLHKGFNSIFAVSSINAAKMYYQEFKRQKSGLKIAIIYSYCANSENTDDYLLNEDSDSTESLNIDDRTFLEKAITEDYNPIFHEQYDTSATLFSNYYKNISKRLKDGDIDILIVVNMFLTGFDSPTLNTLWVDKNLQQHGLIQAFSRTNRIYDASKAYGNIVCFRNLKKEVDAAVALFGDEDAKGIVLLKTYSEYYYGYDDTDKNGKIKHYDGYKELIEKLLTKFPLPYEKHGEKFDKEFIILFGRILRIINILNSFDDFHENNSKIISERDFQDYLSVYNDLYEDFKVTTAKDDVSADIVFEMELVKRVVVNIDYILELVEKYHKDHSLNKEILGDIARAINSNPDLRPKRELIDDFISSLNYDIDEIGIEWRKYKDEKKKEELDKIIKNENLKEKETKELVEKMFRNGLDVLTDSSVIDILPPFHPFFSVIKKEEKKIRTLQILRDFYVKYFD